MVSGTGSDLTERRFHRSGPEVMLPGAGSMMKANTVRLGLQLSAGMNSRITS